MKEVKFELAATAEGIDVGGAVATEERQRSLAKLLAAKDHVSV